MQPVATITPQSSNREVPTLSSPSKGGSPAVKTIDEVQRPQKVELGKLTVIARDTAPTQAPSQPETRPAVHDQERPPDDYFVDCLRDYIKKKAEEAADEGYDELEAALALLASTDLRTSSMPKVSVDLLPGSINEKVGILIEVFDKKKEREFVNSMNEIAAKCVEFAKEFRAALRENNGRLSRDPVNDFVRNTLLPAIIKHHSPDLLDMLPGLESDLVKAWNEIKSLPPLRIRPTMCRIIAELGRAQNDKEFTEEKRCISLVNAMMKCVELLEDHNGNGISIIENSWGRKYPTLYSQKADADPALKAILAYAPGEQVLLKQIVDTFLFNTVAQNENVPDIMHADRAICPITRTAIKLARFARAAQLIAQNMIEIAYQAREFTTAVVVMELQGGHWWGGGGHSEEGGKGRMSGQVEERGLKLQAPPAGGRRTPDLKIVQAV